MPSILSARQNYQWIQRVNQKFKEFEALTPAPAQQQRLRHWLEVEFMASALALEGLSASRQQITEVVEANSANVNSTSGNRALQEADNIGVEKSAAQNVIKETLAALHIIEDLAHQKGRGARLDVALLARLHHPSGDKLDASISPFRQAPSPASSIKAEHLPLIVENACNWFAMDSFAELNPVEQAAIAFLRLVEIAPFASGNLRTALLAASLFLLRGALPPVIIKPEQREAGFAALQEGLRMNTQPMVELFAASVEQTLIEMLQLIAQNK